MWVNLSERKQKNVTNNIIFSYDRQVKITKLNGNKKEHDKKQRDITLKVKHASAT